MPSRSTVRLSAFIEDRRIPCWHGGTAAPKAAIGSMPSALAPALLFRASNVAKSCAVRAVSLLHPHLLLRTDRRSGGARTQIPKGDRSLEFRADFYGAKAMVTLLIHGQRIRSLHNQLMTASASMRGSKASAGPPVCS